MSRGLNRGLWRRLRESRSAHGVGSCRHGGHWLGGQRSTAVISSRRLRNWKKREKVKFCDPCRLGPSEKTKTSPGIVVGGANSEGFFRLGEFEQRSKKPSIS